MYLLTCTYYHVLLLCVYLYMYAVLNWLCNLSMAMGVMKNSSAYIHYVHIFLFEFYPLLSVTRFLSLYCAFTVMPILQYYVGTTLEKQENEQAVFNCSADGIPAPYIVWLRNGQLLIDAANKFSVVNTKTDGFRSQEELPGLVGTASVLTVMSLAITDSGTYLCRASNNPGPGVIMTTPYTLIVTERTLPL